MWPGNPSQKIYCVHLFVECLADPALSIIVINKERETENKTYLPGTFLLKAFCRDRIAVWHELQAKVKSKQMNWQKELQHFKEIKCME